MDAVKVDDVLRLQDFDKDPLARITSAQAQAEEMRRAYPYSYEAVATVPRASG